ncbi:MAG: hypothetical protein IPM53_25520 [Anaerolineaceae bacterium]|nr:hypothetical protein [Anaerolineaceae bacterium]
MSEIKETPEPQEGKSAQEDLDMAKIQESIKGLRQQQVRELQEDLDKFNNRPKPAYYEASSKPQGQFDAALISEGQKKENSGLGNLDMVQVEAAMKGNDLNWTPQDGTADHLIYQNAVEDALDDPDNNVNVYNNERVTNLDGSQGIIDTRINNTILDYKTNDMSNWKTGDALRYGHEHGQQVQDYMESVDTPDDAKGYIIAAGRRPIDPQVDETYANTLGEHNVGVKYPAGGEPVDIVKSADEAFLETSSAPPPEHPPKSAFGEKGDAERAESGAEKTEKEHFSGYGRNPERGS